MLVVRCDVCGEEVLRVAAVGAQHASVLRRHLTIHQRGADTFAPADVLSSFSVRPESERDDSEA